MPSSDSTMKKREFDPKKFLATTGDGRKSVALPTKQSIFSQGDVADAVFYILRRPFALKQFDIPQTVNSSLARVTVALYGTRRRTPPR